MRYVIAVAGVVLVLLGGISVYADHQHNKSLVAEEARTLIPLDNAKHALILIDRTGSMRAEGRCQAALDSSAADVDNFFVNNPGGSVAVWTFAGASATDLTGGFVGWTEAASAVAGLSGETCTGSTPLADAICASVDELVTTFPSMSADSLLLYINSDGDENNSIGECAGPNSVSGPPPTGNYDVGSWQKKAYDKIIGSAVTNVRYWGSVGGPSRVTSDDDSGGTRSPSSVSDAVFFQDIAVSTGGTYQGITSVATCHDSTWASDEYCGFDAYLATGEPEMNHDCEINVLDYILFASEYLMEGPYLSGDFNGDGVVDVYDFNIFGMSYGNSVSPCASNGLPDVCEGSIALSFSADSTTIVSSQNQNPGLNRVYVVIDGWTDARVVEYTLETSSNVLLASESVFYPVWSGNLFGIPHSAYTVSSTEPSWPAGPLTFAAVDYVLMDSEPGWIKFVSSPSCLSHEIRWADSDANRFHNFETILDVVINSGATAIGSDDTPTPFRIVSVTPNPFNPSTTVRFTLPEAMPVTAEIWSVAGERVKVLARDQLFDQGENHLTWDGRDDRGLSAATGVYFLRVTTRLGVKVTRAVLIK